MPCNITLRPDDTSRETESNECVLEIGFLSSEPPPTYDLLIPRLSSIAPSPPDVSDTSRTPPPVEIVASTSPCPVTLLYARLTRLERPSPMNVFSKLAFYQVDPTYVRLAYPPSFLNCPIASRRVGYQEKHTVKSLLLRVQVL